jgi:hypothetical protein
MDIKKMFKEAKEKNTYVFIKGYNLNTPTWQDIINNFNYGYNKGVSYVIPEKNAVIKNDGMKAPLSHNGKIDYVLYNAIEYQKNGSYDHGNYFPELDKMIADFNEAIEGHKMFNGKSHINLISENIDYPKHPDDHDVITWQTNGRIEYRLYKDKLSDKYDSIILNPGDVIYMPAGLYHSVTAIEPRSSIILQFHDLNEDLPW